MLWFENCRNVEVSGITVCGGPFPNSILRGYDAAHGVEDVTFEGLTIHGRPITDAEAEHVEIGPHVANVRFL